MGKIKKNICNLCKTEIIKSKKEIKFSIHHRKPRSIGGENSDRNLITIQDNFHKAWHVLFKNYSPDKICKIINKYYLDPDFYLVVKKTKKIKNKKRSWDILLFFNML